MGERKEIGKMEFITGTDMEFVMGMLVGSITVGWLVGSKYLALLEKRDQRDNQIEANRKKIEELETRIQNKNG